MVAAPSSFLLHPAASFHHHQRHDCSVLRILRLLPPSLVLRRGLLSRLLLPWLLPRLLVRPIRVGRSGLLLMWWGRLRIRAVVRLLATICWRCCPIVGRRLLVPSWLLLLLWRRLPIPSLLLLLLVGVAARRYCCSSSSSTRRPLWWRTICHVCRCLWPGGWGSSVWGLHRVGRVGRALVARVHGVLSL